MRVVAGLYKGRNLCAPEGLAVRPTTTRIKETLFNMLQAEVPDAVVLDLFAGSGALGIEALSRGAAEVAFVDKNRDSIACVRKNLSGMAGNVSVVMQDWMTFLRGASLRRKQFDIIFLDPPYATDFGEKAVELIASSSLLSADGVIVFEHGGEKTYDSLPKGYKTRTKKMGGIVAEFITKKHVALMPGSFDPFTIGHEALLDKALKNYDEVVVGCLVNPDKKYMFTAEQRLEIASAVCASKLGARAVYSEGMTHDLADEVGAETLIRGIRNDEDAAYEAELADFNRSYGLETVFVDAGGYGKVTSTAVREQLRRGDMSGIPAVAREKVRAMLK